MLIPALARRSAIAPSVPGSLLLSIIRTSFSSARTPRSPEDHESFGRIAHHHSHDGVIDRVGCRQGVDVDLFRSQLGADPRKSARPVAEED